MAGRKGRLLPGPRRKTGADLENAGLRRRYEVRGDRGGNELDANHECHSEHADLRSTRLCRALRLKRVMNLAWHRLYSRTPNVGLVRLPLGSPLEGRVGLTRWQEGKATCCPDLCGKQVLTLKTQACGEAARREMIVVRMI